MAIPLLEFQEKIAKLCTQYGYTTALIYLVDKKPELNVCAYGLPGSFLEPIFEMNKELIEKATGPAKQRGENLIKITPNDNKLK
ncbi:MAG TPA: hypothetical protein VGO21_04765 [Candidatus Paceibacterota bacterium]|nr:hypothetical protein [Candidatus Paceibacterota bacterium]